MSKTTHRVHEDCTCGQAIGVCSAGHAPLATWQDDAGVMHVNGMGVIVDEDLIPAARREARRRRPSWGDE